MVDLDETLLHSPRGLSAVAGEGFDTDASLAWILSEPSAPVDSVISAAAQLWSDRKALVRGTWLADAHTGDRSKSMVTLHLRRAGPV